MAGCIAIQKVYCDSGLGGWAALCREAGHDTAMPALTQCHDTGAGRRCWAWRALGGRAQGAQAAGGRLALGAERRRARQASGGRRRRSRAEQAAAARRARGHGRRRGAQERG